MRCPNHNERTLKMTTTESEIETVAKPLIDEATLDRLMAQVESEGLSLIHISEPTRPY